MRDHSLDRALSVRGTAKRIAEALNISEQAVGQWNRVPAERVLEVERLTGVPRNELRPDLYPTEPAETAA